MGPPALVVHEATHWARPWAAATCQVVAEDQEDQHVRRGSKERAADRTRRHCTGAGAGDAWVEEGAGPWGRRAAGGSRGSGEHQEDREEEESPRGSVDRQQGTLSPGIQTEQRRCRAPDTVSVVGEVGAAVVVVVVVAAAAAMMAAQS